MPEEHEAVVKEIVDSIRRLVRAVYLDSLKVSRDYGLTGSQGAVIRKLTIHGPLSSAELSRKLYVTPANITGIIDRLEKKGLVARVRQKSDRRVALIALTPEGEKLGRTLPDPVEMRLASGLIDLPGGDVRTMENSLSRLLDLMDAPKVKGAPLDLGHEANHV